MIDDVYKLAQRAKDIGLTNDIMVMLIAFMMCGRFTLTGMQNDGFRIQIGFLPLRNASLSFNSKDEIKRWHLYSDSEYGGVFSGNLSLEVSEGSGWNFRRSSFCGMRSKKFDGFLDLDAYDTIALKFRGNGRCYISTIRLARYLPTWRGNVIDEQLEMNPSRILGMSLSVNAEGGIPGARFGSGDFRLEIDWIKALRMEGDTVRGFCSRASGSEGRPWKVKSILRETYQKLDCIHNRRI
ncbi:putative complex I intermediate-associated protein 30 [Drosera capensis]